MITAVAIYCLAVGLLMLGWWAVEVRGGVLHRPDRRPVEIGLHLTAETVTAVWLVTAGAALLARGAGASTVAAAGLGMLLYTVIQTEPRLLPRTPRARPGGDVRRARRPHAPALAVMLLRA